MNQSKRITAKAPGSLMLLGEYAVLFGKPALVCAVDKWMSVTVTPRKDRNIFIRTQSLGDHQTTLDNLKLVKPFEFVLAALRTQRKLLSHGLEVAIEAEFSDQIGFGSSAAVTVATLSALHTYLNCTISTRDLVRLGRKVVRLVQGGRGSGADVAAAIYGGMVSYQAAPLLIEKLPVLSDLTVLYSGYKTPTAQAIEQVKNYFAGHPQLFRGICQLIGQCARDGISFVRNHDWVRLGEVMHIQQALLDALGVSPPIMRDMVESLLAQPEIIGAKISGAGLGDCVIGLGKVKANYRYAGKFADVVELPVAMTNKGVYCEES